MGRLARGVAVSALAVLTLGASGEEKPAAIIGFADEVGNFIVTSEGR